MATRWLTAPQQRVWRSYLLGTARLMERLDRDLNCYGISLAEYEVLVRLSEAPERRLRMAELADSVHQSRSRMTHTIARMEAAGLVARTTVSTDRRGVLAELTDDGYARLVEAAPVHVSGVRAGLVDIVDPDDFDAVGRAFAAVIEHYAHQATRPAEDAPAQQLRS